MDKIEILADAINKICEILRNNMSLDLDEHMTLDNIIYQMDCIIEEVRNEITTVKTK